MKLAIVKHQLETLESFFSDEQIHWSQESGCSIAEALQRTIHKQIPIAREMGIRVEEYRDGKLILSAPLARNINHASTAFGGSLNALATLACWGQLAIIQWNMQMHAHIVIQESRIAFKAPVKKDFTAICERPPADQIRRFAKMLRRKGVGRLDLFARVTDGTCVAVEFFGRYVAQINPG